MIQNLDLLRHNYCKATTFTGGTDHELFRLERECEQGKIFLAKALSPVLEVQEFDPTGLEMTYRDDATGAEPVSFVGEDVCAEAAGSDPVDAD